MSMSMSWQFVSDRIRESVKNRDSMDFNDSGNGST